MLLDSVGRKQSRILQHPHDEAHRLKSIDSTPFINLAWLILHYIDTKLAEKALQK
jgi:hypothetical protein